MRKAIPTVVAVPPAKYMLAPNWTVGFEYDYYSFDSNVTAIRTHDLLVDHWIASLDSLQTLTARLNVKLN